MHIDWSVVLGWAIGVAVGIVVLGALLACMKSSRDTREVEKAERRRLEDRVDADREKLRWQGLPQDIVDAYKRTQQWQQAQADEAVRDA